MDKPKGRMLMSAKNAPNEAVQVVVRCRPMSETETNQNHTNIIDVDSSRGTIEITNPKLESNEPKKTFTYDAVFDGRSTQDDIYETVRPLITSVLAGFNGTIFAYGQTGTGKTHTMEGCLKDPEKRGIIGRSFEQIFNHIGRSSNQQFLISTSYLEIYQEEIRDLLQDNNSEKCEIHERADSGVFIKNLSVKVCKNPDEIAYVMARGNECRSTGATNMNEHSSRSHAILTVTIEMIDLELSAGGRKCIRVGKLNLVDLAGSERQGKSGATGERLKEASKINLSLSALGNVISALVDGRTTHVPYRDSKLTRLLQDSLGGNSKTIMVANIGPASYNYEESLTTLRYANRAKNIKNKPKINEDPKDALIRQYREEIASLKEQLEEKRSKSSLYKHGNLDGIMDLMSRDNKASNELDQARNEALETKLAEDKRLTEELEQKIAAIESKVLCGGKNIIDHTNEQQRALEQQNQEIAEKKKVEVLMRQKLELQEDTAMEIFSSFTNLHQEVEAKTRKLKKVFAKFQGVKQEIHDIAEEFNRDRREMEHTQNELLKELKRKYLIIENFIPVEENTKIMQRMFYDEAVDDWVKRPIDCDDKYAINKRPVSADARRPLSDYSRNMATSAGRPLRYQVGENLLSHELYPRPRTTLEYEAPTIAPKIQAVLDQALMVEDDLDIDASKMVSGFTERRERLMSANKSGGPGCKKKTVASASSAGRIDSSQLSGTKGMRGGPTAAVNHMPPRPDGSAYPKARGLVPKK